MGHRHDRGGAGLPVGPPLLPEAVKCLLRGGQVLTAGAGMRSYSAGSRRRVASRNPTLWPASTIRFRRETRRLDPAEYDLIPAPAPAAST